MDGAALDNVALDVEAVEEALADFRSGIDQEIYGILARATADAMDIQIGRGKGGQQVIDCLLMLYGRMLLNAYMTEAELDSDRVRSYVSIVRHIHVTTGRILTALENKHCG